MERNRCYLVHFFFLFFFFSSTSVTYTPWKSTASLAHYFLLHLAFSAFSLISLSHHSPMFIWFTTSPSSCACYHALGSLSFGFFYSMPVLIYLIMGSLLCFIWFSLLNKCIKLLIIRGSHIVLSRMIHHNIVIQIIMSLLFYKNN